MKTDTKATLAAVLFIIPIAPVFFKLASGIIKTLVRLWTF